MENHQTPAEFVNLIKNYNRTIRDFPNVKISLQPQVPRDSSESGLHVAESAQKQHHEHRELPSPLSSTEVSLTLSVEDLAQRIARQLDEKNENNAVFLRLEEQSTSDESDDLNNTLFNAKESQSRTRISKIVKQVLKICGYAVAATIAVPLIAGGGVITIVVAGVAGIVSIPVLCTLNKYQRDLRLDREPYPYSCVVEEIFKLCQNFATKLASARFLKKDCGLEFNVGRKLTDEEMAQDVWDWNEDSVNSHNVHAQSFSGWENVDEEEIVNEIDNLAQVFLEGETAKQIAQDVEDRNESRVITYETRPHVSFEREKSNKGNLESVWDWGDKDTQATIFSQRDPGEGTSNAMDCGVESVSTHETHVQVPLEKETQKETVDNLRDWDEQIMLESMRKARAHALSEIALPTRATEFKTDDEPSANLPLSPRAVTYYDEPQNSSYIDENPAASKINLEIVDANKEDEDSGIVEDQNFRDEMSGTESKLADGRKGLSDEEDIYGRQDLQCISPRKSFSDTFCCVKVRNDDKNANRRDFVRFSRRDHYEIDTNLSWETLEQVENNEGAAETQVQGTEEGCTARKQEPEELPEKGSKKGKRRRKRRTNKRIAAEHVNEADDELDKDELEQATLNTSKKPEAEHKNKQKAAELQGKTTTPQKGKQPAQKLIEKNKDEAKMIEVSSVKTLRKMVNLKKKDKAKKESLAQNDVQSEKPKRKLLRFLTRGKNTADCHEQKKSNNNNSPIAKSSKAVKAQKACVAKTTPTAHAKVEEEKDRDVMSLYDDID